MTYTVVTSGQNVTVGVVESQNQYDVVIASSGPQGAQGAQGPAGPGSNIDPLVVDANTGTITFPGGALIQPNQIPGSIDLISGNNGWAELASYQGNNYIWLDEAGSYISTGWNTTPGQWTFANTTLALPQTSSITAANGSIILHTAQNPEVSPRENYLSMYSDGDDAFTELEARANNNATAMVGVYGTVDNNQVQIYLYDGVSVERSWRFFQNGTLSMAGNVDVPGTVRVGNTTNYTSVNSTMFTANNVGGYNNPAFFVPYEGDSWWSYGAFSNTSDVWLQTRIWGDGTTNKGFRVLDSSSNTVLFKVDSTGSGTLSGNLSVTGSLKFLDGTSLNTANGAQGAQGTTGSNGAQGSQGFQGTAGSAGSQGAQGFQGYQGFQGRQGAQGAAGTGSQGFQGAQGFQGFQGYQGRQGAQGVQGTAGSNGSQGFQGNQGATGAGSQGAQGFQGNQGTSGSAGSQGFQGNQGATGTGSQGAQGNQGFQGYQGAQGNQGNQGVAGTGSQGFQGAQGSGSVDVSATYAWTNTHSFAANVSTTGVLTLEQSQERFNTYANANGLFTLECSNSNIFNLTSPAAAFTPSLSNFALDSGYASAITIVINQGGTGYAPTSNVQIGGANTTVSWQGGSAPSGNANKKDIVVYSILNSSGTYTILGQLVSFG